MFLKKERSGWESDNDGGCEYPWLTTQPRRLETGNKYKEDDDDDVIK